MKNIVIIAVLFVIVIFAFRSIMIKAKKGGGCCGEHEESITRVIVSDRNKKHYAYKITMVIGGMTCENCARRVENALNIIPDTWATVDISSKKAKVMLKAEPDEIILRKAVAEAGYTVLEIY